MRQPFISIIVPVYNIKEYLPRCVCSIRRQTYQNLEILLVDDGSTDGTGELCEELAREDARIRVLHKENGGTSSARNLGLASALGDYIGFVDSDDYIEKDMYERLVEAALRRGSPIVQVGRDEIDEKGTHLPDICIPPKEEQAIPEEDFLRELLMHRGDCSFCTKLVKKELFRGKGFPEGALNEDFHLLVLMLMEGIEKRNSGDGERPPILSLPGQAYHVFYRSGSNTRKENAEQFSRVYGDNVDNAEMVLELVRQNCPELEEVAFRFGVYQRLDFLLHIPISRMRRDNGQYRKIVSWMRANWMRALGNPYLTIRNKGYHVLFAVAPRGIRVLHRKIRG